MASNVENKQHFSAVSLPWVEKYRPKNLGELISQDSIIETSKSKKCPSKFLIFSFNIWFDKFKGLWKMISYHIFCSTDRLARERPRQF